MTAIDLSTTKVNSIIGQFQDFFDIYDNLVPYLSIEDKTKASIEKKRSWIDRLTDGEFPVAFLGSFSAGKSTIINGILGREVLPEDTKSTTAFPTIIKKGSKDLACVYYIDEDTRMTLWNQLAKEIGDKIDKDLKILPEEKDKKGIHIKRIQDEIDRFEENSNTKIGRTSLENMKKLLQGWVKPEYKEKYREITIGELKEYVEGHHDSLNIDRIEVFLQDINIPSYIVLVDLPGLSVANQRHVDFTKHYIREKAKAFVVCMKPKSLLEGEEITFLGETSRNNPTILQRAFWVINQWDTLNEQQRKEEESNFQEKVKINNFNINNERCFKVSALNYLLLKCLADDTISQQPKLKTQISNLQKSALNIENYNLSPEEARNLLNHPEIESFSNFCKSLFEYLNKNAKDEFINDARRELIQAIRSLERATEALSKHYAKAINPGLGISSVAVDRQRDYFLSTVQGKIEAFTKSARISEQDIWRQSDTQRIISEINDKILKINFEDLKNKLSAGFDIPPEGIMTRLPDILEKEIQLTSSIRKQMIASIDALFVNKLENLRTDIESIGLENFPEDLIKKLDDKLSGRDISMRLKGVADVLFQAYGKEVSKISFPDNLSDSLKTYKEEAGKLANILVKDLNYAMRSSIKNHSEDLERELTELFRLSRDSITEQITGNIDFDAAKDAETKKQTAIVEGHKKLLEIKNLIMANLNNDDSLSVDNISS